MAFFHPGDKHPQELTLRALDDLYTTVARAAGANPSEFNQNALSVMQTCHDSVTSAFDQVANTEQSITPFRLV